MSKYDSLKDEVVDRAWSTGLYRGDTIEADGFGHYALMLDFYGKDYIIHTNNDGFVDVDSFAATFAQDGKTFRSAESGNAWVEIYDAYIDWATPELDEDYWND